MPLKQCSKCDQEKDLETGFEFVLKRGKGVYRAECKSCRAARITQWRKDNPAKYREQYDRARYKMHYGLHPDQVKKFGVCPICLVEKRLVVDHDHKLGRGQYRGFICMTCNTILGHVENQEKMSRIRLYLQQGSK